MARMPKWMTEALSGKSLEGHQISVISSWFSMSTKTTSLQKYIEDGIRKSVEKDFRSGYIDEVARKQRISLAWKESLDITAKFVSVYLPEAIPDYDHFLDICPFCGFRNSVSISRRRGDFGSYREYNMMCSGCGRLRPYAYLMSCPVCNSGCSVPLSRVARYQMYMADMKLQANYMKDTGRLELPRFDPSIPFVDRPDNFEMIREGTPLFYGFFEDARHLPDWTKSDARPWCETVLFCPFDLTKWSVYLLPVEKPEAVDVQNECFYCGFPLSKPRKTDYGVRYRCTNKECNFEHPQPFYIWMIPASTETGEEKKESVSEGEEE